MRLRRGIKRHEERERERESERERERERERETDRERESGGKKKILRERQRNNITIRGAI